MNPLTDDDKTQFRIQVTAVANFYDVLRGQILRFLEFNSPIQPQVIDQVFRQLLHLSQQITNDSCCDTDEFRQSRAERPLQPYKVVPDTHPQSVIPRGEHLRQVEHDLRSTFGILSTAASLLQKPLKTDDQAKYWDMLHRNVNIASNLLNQLAGYASVKETGKS